MKPAIVTLALLLLAGCGAEDLTPDPTPATDPGSFRGAITWVATVTGDDQDGVVAFRGLAPNRVRVFYGDDRFRIETTGGMNAGVLVVLPVEDGARRGYLLDPERRTFERSNWVKDLDDDAGFELQEPEDAETILGHPTRRWKIKSSDLLGPDADASVWLAADLDLPPARFQADFDAQRLKSPTPLALAVESGAPLKIEILSDDVLVTWTATEIAPGPPEASVFGVPDGYEDAGD